MGPQSPMKRAEGCPAAGVGGDTIPEGKDSVLCRVLKSRLCPRSQRGAHSVLPGGPGASAWRLSGLPGVSSGPSPTPIPRNDRILQTRDRNCHSWEPQSPNRFLSISPSSQVMSPSVIKHV